MATALALLLPVAFRAQPDVATQDEKLLGLRGLLRIRRLIGAFFVVAAYFVFIGAFEAVWDWSWTREVPHGPCWVLPSLPVPSLLLFYRLSVAR